MFKFLCFIFLFISCDTVEEVYLYDKEDPEYSTLLQMAAQQCVDEAKIFDALDKMRDFENYGFFNRTYKISQDTQNKTDIYVRVTSVSATQMELTFNSSNNDLDKILVFETNDHDDLISELKIMSCNLGLKDHFSASSLASDDNVKLTWKKETITVLDSPDDEDDDPEGYDRREDTFTFDNDLPLVFFYYNATKTAKVKTDEDEQEQSSTSKITIKDVTGEDECNTSSDDYNSNCEFSSVTKVCNIVVNTGIYNSNAYSDEIISPVETGCELLKSATL